MSSPLEQPKPLYEQLYKTLREAILSGDYGPGERLVASQIATRFSVSRTPVREAFMKLKQDGLVVEAHPGGVKVYDPQPEDIHALYCCRAAVEGQAAYFAALQISEAQIARLETIHADMDDAYERDDVFAIMEANTAFHELIVEASDNQWLARLHDVTRAYALYVRLFQLHQHFEKELVLQHHEEILAALKEGRADEARTRMETHINANRDLAARELSLDTTEGADVSGG